MFMKKIQYITLGLAASLFVCGAAMAADQPVTADIAFDAALSLNKTADINFGIVKSLTTGTYAINTSGTVTPSNGGVVIGGSTSAASISITGSASQTVDISAGSYTADSGVTPSAAVCKYGAGAEQACSYSGAAAPGAGGTTLLVGVTVAADGSQAAGSSATPSFTVTVVYS